MGVSSPLAGNLWQSLQVKNRSSLSSGEPRDSRKTPLSRRSDMWHSKHPYSLGHFSFWLHSWEKWFLGHQDANSKMCFRPCPGSASNLVQPLPPLLAYFSPVREAKAQQLEPSPTQFWWPWAQLVPASVKVFSCYIWIHLSLRVDQYEIFVVYHFADDS